MSVAKPRGDGTPNPFVGPWPHEEAALAIVQIAELRPSKLDGVPRPEAKRKLAAGRDARGTARAVRRPRQPATGPRGPSPR